MGLMVAAIVSDLGGFDVTVDDDELLDLDDTCKLAMRLRDVDILFFY